MSTAERASELVANYQVVRQEIKAVTAAQGIAAEPRLVVVSKYKPAEDIQALYDHGHRHFGENYVQELTGKAEQLPKDINWHFIGALQSNKCKVLSAIPNMYAVETLDSESKANKLNNAREANGSKINVFIQVNTSDEEQKAGAQGVQEVIKLATHIVEKCDKLILKGLMTIGSVEQSKGSSDMNLDFQKLADIKHQVDKQLGTNLELSMGMSSDYIQGIKQGSTNVRVGSAIFGARMTKEEIKTQS